jgi:GNAT superfamily N-acetyltransferase
MWLQFLSCAEGRLMLCCAVLCCAVLQRCAYLCNMAVAKEWQRKGIASTLMTAVEDLCLLAGELSWGYCTAL